MKQGSSTLKTIWALLLLIVPIMTVLAILHDQLYEMAWGSPGLDIRTDPLYEQAAPLRLVDGKYDPPVTMTTVRAVGPTLVFREGESIEDNVHIRWARERLGIEINHLWTAPETNGAFELRLRAALLAGQPLPDIINVPAGGTLTQELIDSGQFREVGALFDRYANHTWKSAMSEAVQDWYPYMREGKRYALPALDYIKMNEKVMWIRKDWLDRLELAAPATLEDLETVMRAFKTMDPDGDGAENTIPLALGLKSQLNAWIDAGFIFGMFGILPEVWLHDEEGKLQYGSVQPGAKAALSKIRDWMSNGYVHIEAGLHDEWSAAQLFATGRAGIAVGPTWAYAWPLSEVEQRIPGARIAPYPLPSGPDGQAGRLGLSSHNRVTLINRDMEHPEIFFTYMNYLYDHYADPKPGSEFQYGVAEGYDWLKVDERIVMEEQAIRLHQGEFYKAEAYFPVQPAPRIPSLQLRTFAHLYGGAEPQTPYEAKIAAKLTPQIGAAAQIILKQANATIYNEFRGSPTPTMREKQELLQSLERSAFRQIIYGERSLDAFDEFVEAWNEAGGSAITAEVNDWYDSVRVSMRVLEGAVSSE